ncbi:similar to Saccharomyces cerevisiae YCR095C OCA4 Cytoplasmic protein required for replication of Brome mosaic virus in S. cerevisiae [Maudiozyma saulgeensis]|uniref:Similar to Saccharomyces cerevisiae YCR095C OCA4 Cytoplasmic protein required for replication of Brome mosaic virus in S. cerevisiae n=1 Tax=Maudiozyma saulgeensis TaxID=1789683 RepID=A0A1X7QYY9_9SACH|nr:similar to Saccharomyces cerevisiae YCR095C OCA4 Cytoplasmic protein required for replication of Brome mosaic virus in S. cerevisiae [Kazachstania saulgeensis]
MLVPPANFGIAEEGIYRCSKVETLNLSFLETLELKTVIYIGGQEPSKFFKEFFNRSSIEWLSIRTADYANVGPQVNSLKNSEIVSEEEQEEDDEKKDELNTIQRNLDSNDTLEIKDLGHVKASEFPSPRPKVENSMVNGIDGIIEGDLDINEKRTSVKNKHLKYTLNDSDELMLIKSYCLKKTFKMLLDQKFYNILLVDKTALIIGILRKIQKWNISSIINEYRLYAGKNRSYFAETYLELIELRIEQEKIDSTNSDKKALLNAESTKDVIDNHRKLSRSNLIFVTEDELCNPPEIPARMIAIVEETERRENPDMQNEDEFNEESEKSHNMKRSTSDMGIFGHRYRLTFNRKENGDYDYYKNENSQYKENDYIRLHIPNELELPEWFKFQRDTWEQDNAPEVHHFYKEQIFV